MVDVIFTRFVGLVLKTAALLEVACVADIGLSCASLELDPLSAEGSRDAELLVDFGCAMLLRFVRDP